MFEKLNTIQTCLFTRILRAKTFLRQPGSQRGEESASVAAITGLVLLIILVVMAIFRGALEAAFNRISALLSF